MSKQVNERSKKTYVVKKGVEIELDVFYEDKNRNKSVFVRSLLTTKELFFDENRLIIKRKDSTFTKLNSCKKDKIISFYTGYPVFAKIKSEDIYISDIYKKENLRFIQNIWISTVNDNVLSEEMLYLQSMKKILNISPNPD